MLAPLSIGIVMGLLFAWAVMALALAFRLLHFPDLTVEGSLPLGAAVFGALYKAGVPMPVATVCAVLSGGLAGACTGFIHAKLRVNKFLSGIILIAITYSLSLRIMGASNIGLLQASSLFDIVKPLDHACGNLVPLGTVLLLAGMLCLGSVALLVALASRRGVALRVAGSNPMYAGALGISVAGNLIVGLAITNCLAALCGVLLSMHQGFADIGMGQGVLILALAAMTIGERLLPERRFPFQLFVVCAAIIGSIVYQVVVAFAVRAGLAATDLKLVTAMMVLAVVAFRLTRDGDLLSEAEV